MYRIFLLIIMYSICCLYAAYEEGKNIDRYYSNRLGGLKRIKLSKIPPRIRKLLRFDKSIREQVLFASIMLQLNGIAFFCACAVLALLIIIFSFSFTVAGICVYTVLMLHALIKCTIMFITSARYHKNMKPFKIKAKRCWKLEFYKCFMVGYPFCKVKVISSYVTDRDQTLYRIKYGKWFVREFDAVSSLGFKPKMDRVVMAVYATDAPYFEIYKYADS